MNNTLACKRLRTLRVEGDITIYDGAIIDIS